MIEPLAGIAAVLVALGGLLGALTLYRGYGHPHPELLRKLLHVGMGLVTLSFPWLFDRAWPVAALCLLSIVLLVSLRRVAALKSGVGRVVSGVARASLGDIYFPLAVCILWLLYLDDAAQAPALRLLGYLIPLLLLTLSDASAALVGVAYGRYRFATPDGMKSLEGSFAFFLCSFTCVHVPVLLMTDCGRAETLLIALLLAWLTTMLEAIAWGGLDNLILPIVAYLMLQVYWHQTAPALLARLGVTGGVTVFAAVLYRFTPLRGSAVLGASLIGYVFWTLGGWHWLVSPLILFTTSAVLTIHYPAAKDKTLNVYAVLSVTSAGLLWLCLTQVQDGADWCYPSTVSFAAHTGMVILGRLRYAHPAAPRSIIVGLSGLAGGVLILVPYVLFNALAVAAILGVLLGLLLCGLAVVVFDQIQPGIDDTPFDTPRWVRQAVVAGVVSLLAAGVGAINAP